VAFRVPTSTGSITDFTAQVSRDVTTEGINEAYKKASEGSMKGILEYNDEPLVSSDYKGNSHSCIIDGLSTMVMADRMVKVMGWYDNEWGYSCRTTDLAALIAEKGI
jgi:glyceraldehyde 3-phosphate dehydrogenase